MISCIYLPNSHKIIFQARFLYSHIAVVWVHWVCRATFLHNLVLFVLHLLEQILFLALLNRKASASFFHILGAVEQQRGCCDVGNGQYEITIYTDCYNAEKGIFYYTTYQNHQISAVHLHNEPLDSDFLIRYPMITGEQIHYQN